MTEWFKEESFWSDLYSFLFPAQRMEAAQEEVEKLLARIFQPTTSERLPDGSTLVERHEIIDGWTGIRNEWILVKDGEARIYKFNLRLYSGQELENLLEQAGFTEVRIYGNLAGDAYDNEASRLVLAAVKGS